MSRHTRITRRMFIQPLERFKAHVHKAWSVQGIFPSLLCPVNVHKFPKCIGIPIKSVHIVAKACQLSVTADCRFWQAPHHPPKATTKDERTDTGSSPNYLLPLPK